MLGVVGYRRPCASCSIPRIQGYDRVRAFQYSFEPATPSAELDQQIAEEAKQDRYERLMEMQQLILLKRNQLHVGCTLDVLLEGLGAGLTLGRLVPRCAGDRRHGDSGRRRARGSVRAGED